MAEDHEGDIFSMVEDHTSQIDWRSKALKDKGEGWVGTDLVGDKNVADIQEQAKSGNFSGPIEKDGVSYDIITNPDDENDIWVVKKESAEA